MKKLPVLLLALTAGTMAPVQTVCALEEWNVARQNTEMDEPVKQGTAAELPVLNALDQRFIIQTMKPREGEINLEIISPAGKEWQIRRVWFATLDYEGGWTEAEVDKRLDEWTELDAEWAKVTKEQPLENMSLWSFATVLLTIGESKLQYDLTTVNLLDVLYYAAEFEDLEGKEDGPIWVRGKIDYRGCAHAKSFLEGETGLCVAQIDKQEGTVKYWPDEAQADEQVVTWEEEWRLVLAERLTEVETVLNELAPSELSPATLEWILGQQEEKLTSIEKLLSKAVGVSGEIKEAKRLRAKIAALRNWESGNGSGSSGGTGSGPAGNGVGSGEEGGNGASSEVEGGLGSGMNGSDAVGGGADNSGSGGVSGVIAASGVAIAGAEAIEDGLVGDNIGVTVPVENNGEADAVAVEVPKLGGAKAERGWLWWVAGVAMALSLFFVAVLKRKQGKDRQR